MNDPLKPTTVQRASKGNGQRFARILNATLQDGRLSFRARGVLAFVISKPDHWQHSAKRLAATSTEGVDAIQAAFRELVALGYMDNLSLMRWSARKRELFTTRWEKPPAGPIPDWGFSTRVAQLARQLRDAMRLWMGLKDENEVARRVGTVSGYFTAQCRKVWMEGYRKDRSDLRNHLYDAMVVSHIPPGVGLNTTAFGGIFETAAVRHLDGGIVFANRPLAGISQVLRRIDRGAAFGRDGWKRCSNKNGSTVRRNARTSLAVSNRHFSIAEHHSINDRIVCQGPSQSWQL
jgi:hypothetical protein